MLYQQCMSMRRSVILQSNIIPAKFKLINTRICPNMDRMKKYSCNQYVVPQHEFACVHRPHKYGHIEHVLCGYTLLLAAFGCSCAPVCTAVTEESAESGSDEDAAEADERANTDDSTAGGESEEKEEEGAELELLAGHTPLEWKVTSGKGEGGRRRRKRKKLDRETKATLQREEV